MNNKSRVLITKLYCKSSIKPRWGFIYFPSPVKGGALIEMGRWFERRGWFNLETTMVSVLHKELDFKVEKLNYKKY